MKCGIPYCKFEQYAEGVCFWHYPLREHWGYNLGGYNIYLTRGRVKGRKRFHAWLRGLTQREIVDIYSNYPWNLMNVGLEKKENEKI